MSQLIPYEKRQVGTETIETVNARDLHAGLGIGKDFSSWIKVQLKRAQLDENRDYIKLTQKGELSATGQISIEYFLTFDAAKHIALMSGSAKGKEVREYFIACEKALREEPATRGDMLVAMAEAYRRQENKILALESAQREANEQSRKAMEMAYLSPKNQTFFTIAEYVYHNHLSAQVPQSEHRAFSEAMRHYCYEYGIPFRRQAVGGKKWNDELSFPLTAYEVVAPSWILRLGQRPKLEAVPPHVTPHIADIH